MKLMPCPLNGPRNLSEFVCAGEVKPEADPDGLDDAGWCQALFMTENRMGVVREWWRHAPTNFWFIAERDTRTGEILRTFKPADLPPQAGAATDGEATDGEAT